jgi:hypothetical protein
MLFSHDSWHGDDGSPERATILTYHSRKKFLTRLTNELLSEGILAFNLTDPSKSDGGDHHSTSYMGVAAPLTLDPVNEESSSSGDVGSGGDVGGGGGSGGDRGGGKHRRIDMKCYPMEEMPFALLYFTGNAYFNRSMRWYAKRKGLTLSDHGLCECVRQRNVGKILIHDSVKVKCEKDIFDCLGLGVISLYILLFYYYCFRWWLLLLLFLHNDLVNYINSPQRAISNFIFLSFACVSPVFITNTTHKLFIYSTCRQASASVTRK